MSSWRARSNAPTNATPSAPELPSPDPGGASQRGLRARNTAPHRATRRRNHAAAARSRGIRWGDRAVSLLHVPRNDTRQLAAHIHAYATHALVHRLDTARVVQPHDRQSLREYALRQNRIRRHWNAGELAE